MKSFVLLTAGAVLLYTVLSGKAPALWEAVLGLPVPSPTNTPVQTPNPNWFDPNNGGGGGGGGAG